MLTCAEPQSGGVDGGTVAGQPKAAALKGVRRQLDEPGPRHRRAPVHLDARDESLGGRCEEPLESAVVGDWAVSREDLVLGDDDGVLFLSSPQAEEIFTLAETIRDTERRQAERIRAGASLRTQVQFRAYLAKRENTPSLSFREHLRTVGGAIEE